LNIYTTGPSDATRAILLIYDIFGLANQTLQGADILAKLTDSLVLVPDFFHGQPLEMDVLPADTEEKKLRFGKFFQEKV
jgi:dienelactone hydrolase